MIKMASLKESDIKDCIFIASEAINMLLKEAKGGNVVIKIDISKAFDTFSLNFFAIGVASFWF